jgi:putative addiction module component (TIGR02574 family)
VSKTQKLLQEALALPVDARGRLAAKLIESIDGPAEPGAAASWDAEVDRRLDAMDAGVAKSVSWRSVERELLKRRGARRR